MSYVPDDLKYDESHEWIKHDDDDSAIIYIGITDFAQSQLGDLVYITLPEVGQRFLAGEKCATVESVKTASDLFSPVIGEVIAVNEEVIDSPELVNEQPYDTWLFSIRVDDVNDLNKLMNAESYQEMIDG